MMDARKIEALAVRNTKKEIKKTRIDLFNDARELVERQKEEMFIANETSKNH